MIRMTGISLPSSSKVQGSLINSDSSSPSILNNNPQKIEGISDLHRHEVGDLIQKTCTHLGVSTWSTATACIYFHQFYQHESSTKRNQTITAAGCVLLACKVKEEKQYIEKIISSVYKVRNNGDNISPSSPQFQALRKAILEAELNILRALAFDISVQLPYPHILRQFGEIIPNTLADRPKILLDLQKSAWKLCNDALRYTNLCLQFQAHILAVGMIWLTLDLVLNPRKGRPSILPPDAAQSLKSALKDKWWEDYDVDIDQIFSIRDRMNKFFQLLKTIRKNQTKNKKNIHNRKIHNRSSSGGPPPLESASDISHGNSKRIDRRSIRHHQSGSHRPHQRNKQTPNMQNPRSGHSSSGNQHNYQHRHKNVNNSLNQHRYHGPSPPSQGQISHRPNNPHEMPHHLQHSQSVQRQHPSPPSSSHHHQKPHSHSQQRQQHRPQQQRQPHAHSSQQRHQHHRPVPRKHPHQQPLHSNNQQRSPQKRFPSARHKRPRSFSPPRNVGKNDLSWQLGNNSNPNKIKNKSFNKSNHNPRRG